MKKAMALIVSVLLLFAGCSDSTGPKSNDTDNGGGTVVATADVGADGGTVESDDVTLTVPAGAFESSREVNIVEAVEQYESEDCVTGTYMVLGIPEDFAAPVTVSLKYTGELSGETVIALGLPVTYDDGTEAVDFHFYPAESENGFITAEIPPLIQSSVVAKRADYDENNIIVWLFGLTKQQYYVSPEDHVSIDYPLTFIDIIPTVGGYIEEAYTLFKDMGFSYEPYGTMYRKLNKIRAKVYEFNFYKELYTRSYTNFERFFRDDEPYGYVMSINSGMIRGDQTKLKESIFRNVFGYQHYICNIDDNETLQWFHNAAEHWVGELASSGDYVPDGIAGNELSVLAGLAQSEDADLGVCNSYCNGMAAFVEYLCDTKNNRQTLVNIYKAMHAGDHSIGALEDFIGSESGEWWPDFVKAYVSGEVYGITAEKFLAGIDGTFTINDKTDTLAVFTDQYSGLSAKMYRINLDYAAIDSTSTLSLSVDAGPAEVLLYGIKGKTLEYFDRSYEIEVAQVKELTDAGYDLLAVVTNADYSMNLSAYDEITLRVEIDAAPPIDLTDFNYCSISVYNFRCKYSDGETSNLFSYSWSIGGSFDGSTWRGEESSSTKDVSITVEIDFDSMTVTSFTASYCLYRDRIDTRYTIRGHDIPLMEYHEAYSILKFDLRGTNAKDGLDYLTYDSEFKSLVTYDTPSEESGIRVHIYDR